jgi:hypothetical protein
MQAITFDGTLVADRELDVYLVLTILAFSLLGAVSAVSVFMTGFTGEPFGRIAAKAVSFLLLILIVLYLFK